MAVLRFAVFSESPEIYARVAQALGAIEGVEIAPLSARGSDLGTALARAELDGLYIDLGRQPEALLGALERAPAGRFEVADEPRPVGVDERPARVEDAGPRAV